MPIEDDETIKQILEESKIIAVVGASARSTRDSHRIAKFLIDRGYRVVPVNPNYDKVLGLKCYPDLGSVEEKIDIVDIFRRSEAVPSIVEEAINVGAKTIWMQFGVIHVLAAKRAEEAGLQVVMDRCIAIEHRNLVS